ncbi:MAG TPA: CpsB/CapC family capsule biosynthesis tyrosine phosphatase [Anaeromyxobacter sp.]|nr:CpsB/CapC family capsule biosynthesis tyrosine phosphatase [Anaeromyxobacter sp.]
MGYVDLHCHLLWALDDGCETPAETVAAARLLVELGFSDAAPSPHAVPGLPSGDAARAEARLGEAAALLAREGIPLALHRNAENRLDEEFLARAGGEGRRGLGAGQRWVLVEVPFEAPVPALAELVFALRRKGVSPLFAHPERCAEFERSGRAEEVVRLGGALQLNVGALAGVYGREVRRLAERLVSEGLYAVASTDLHRPDGVREWLAEALAALERRAGADGFERLLGGNPRRILAGEDLA